MKFTRLFFLKNKIVQSYEHSALQFMSVLSRNEDKDIINNFKCNAKTHSIMDEKKFILVYAEHIYFLVTRAGCLVSNYLSAFYI